MKDKDIMVIGGLGLAAWLLLSKKDSPVGQVISSVIPDIGMPGFDFSGLLSGFKLPDVVTNIVSGVGAAGDALDTVKEAGEKVAEVVEVVTGGGGGGWWPFRWPWDTDTDTDSDPDTPENGKGTDFDAAEKFYKAPPQVVAEHEYKETLEDSGYRTQRGAMPMQTQHGEGFIAPWTQVIIDNLTGLVVSPEDVYMERGKTSAYKRYLLQPHGKEAKERAIEATQPGHYVGGGSQHFGEYPEGENETMVTEKHPEYRDYAHFISEAMP